MPTDPSGRVPTGHDRTQHDGLSLDQRLALTAALSRLRREFHGVVDTATIEQVLHTSHDLVTADSAITRFLRAKRFAHQQLQALARVHDRHPDSAPLVLFLSTHDDSCSPMARGLFQHLADDRAVAWSGGSDPANAVNPTAVAAMQERGIDITSEFPKPWTTEIIQAADLVITIGCRDTCPVYPETRSRCWDIHNPANSSLHAIRPIRDTIEHHVRTLLDDLAIPARTRPTPTPPDTPGPATTTNTPLHRADRRADRPIPTECDPRPCESNRLFIGRVEPDTAIDPSLLGVGPPR